jgi:CO/xanthine dehydrogenase Mo-binding subunit
MMIGSKIPRVDGVEKVTGEAKFTADLRFPGMLEAKVLRSPLPHAAIESIDARRAEALPGVVAVLTRDDLKDINPFYGNCFRDRAIVAIDRVRFVGEPVAMIAAEDGLIAEEALALVDVRYRELPVLSTVEDALAPEAILLHENVSGAGEFHDIASLGGKSQPNVCHREYYEKGDVARGFAEADEVIEES